VKAIHAALAAHGLLVIDEIGPMEIRSAAFRGAVIEVLESDRPVLATIFARPLPFTEKLKRRLDVTLIEVRPDNRTKLVTELVKRFRVEK
jgi:nucleoside-triphosphatase